MKILKNGINLSGRMVMVTRILSDRPKYSDVPRYGWILKDAVYDATKREPCPYTQLGKVFWFDDHLDKEIVAVGWLMPDKSIEVAFVHLDDIVTTEGTT